MVYRLSQLEMREMSGTLLQVSGAGHAPATLVDDALTRVHEAAELRLAVFVNLRELDLAHGHALLEKVQLETVPAEFNAHLWTI